MTSLARALAVISDLPAPALALLAQRIIDRLDAADDTETEHDGCDDGRLPWEVLNGPGDDDDAEDDGADCCGAGDCGGCL